MSVEPRSRSDSSSSDRSPETQDDRTLQFDALLFEYIDRLNAGEILDPELIEGEHPELAETLIERLKVYQALGEPGDEVDLGTLGDYRLRRQIGRGGMGVVYEAWQNSMDRQVALKVLPVGIAADTRACTRFMREAQTAGKLNHQNIVGVHSTGIEEGTPWYSMEYVEGETLAQILTKIKDVEPDTETVFGHKDSAAYFDKLARAFADVADGLQHAHSKGVIHRDIKPSNLILDGDGRLRILDFGLARLEGQESMTMSGDLIGTVLYMSPEQAMAKRIPLDHRTDIYSLGATMYEMLTSRPPFQGKNYQDTLSQIIFRDPQSLRRSNSRIPSDLETVVSKCMRKESGDRYSTIEALAQDLRRFVRGDPVEARPRSAWETLARRVRRYRKVVIAVAATFVLAFVGLVVAMALIGEARNIAVQERDEANYNFYLAQIRMAQQDWETGQIRRLHEGLEKCQPRPDHPDVRCWEWYYLLSLCHRELATLHQSGAHDAEWSPNGHRLASAGQDGRTIVWDEATGEELQALSGKGVAVLSVAWSPDGAHLASVTSDHTVEVWDTLTGKEIRTLSDESAPTPGEPNRMFRVEWSPRGNRLATLTAYEKIVVWDFASGEAILSIRRLAFSLAWSPDGMRLASGGQGRVTISDTTNGEVLQTLKGDHLEILSVAWSPDGKRLATGGFDPRARVWDLRTGREVFSLLHGGAVEAVAWSPDGQYLATAGREQRVRVWDVTTPEGVDQGPEPRVRDKPLLTFQGHRGWINSVAWRPDGQRLVSSSEDGVKIWDVTQEQEALTVRHAEEAARQSAKETPSPVAWSPDDERLAYRWSDGEVKICDTTTGDEIFSFPGRSRPAWSPDGQRLACVDKTGQIRIWDSISGQEILRPKIRTRLGGNARSSSLAWRPDGRQLAAVDKAEVKILDPMTGMEVLSLEADGDPLRTLAWSPDSGRLATSGWDGTVTVWEVGSWRKLYTLEGHWPEKWVGALAWSPGGERLASGGWDQTVKIWDASVGREIHTLRGHTGTIASVSWSGDGKRIVSGSTDGTVRIWDAASGEEVFTLRGQGSKVNAAWSHDGRRIATVSRSRVAIWDASIGYELANSLGHGK